MVIRQVLLHLWGHIVLGATEGLSHPTVLHSRPTKVGDFDISLLVQEDVLRLKVSMDHILGMNVLQTQGGLQEKDEGLVFLNEPSSFLKVFEK